MIIKTNFVKKKGCACLWQSKSEGKGKGKGKVHPRTGHEDPDGE